ncbi:hypothetical protein OIU77_007371 [Salix suchowensis]|uniref:Piwi domain-containing protein n=1 Tax=Salix suchowensis TaxID=1278906 RepID=A0ABQ9AH53_9ROSI|nr:hypothetical protein OIU77_007371 [Salix suchowensis]
MKNYVPMEFCVLVEGQVFPKERLMEKETKMLKKFSLANPKDRQKTICRMVQDGDGPCGSKRITLKYDKHSGGEIIRNFGVEVSKNMTALAGRVIGPPELKEWLKGNQSSDGLFLISAPMMKNRLNQCRFIPKLIAQCRNLGIHMEKPLIYQRSSMWMFSNVDVLREQLETINEQARKSCGGQLQFLLCVMSGKDPGYKHLKWISETKVELSDRLPYFGNENHVMFIGADVNHPGAQNTRSPSIAAVVGTINWPAANRYAARVRPQYHRKEKILNFGDMCLELVECYSRLNKVKPEKIVIFRDGVSEGQFDMVLNEELMDIMKAFKSINYTPTITLIVAQKRHQTRLFPGDEGSTGNVSPGTVVDTTIVHPFKYDFYLCSHYGSLGTSKPTHYYVLWDEHGLSSDDLQKLIYNMCFTFARCTKPVSLVPPVYYADLVAYRGSLYHEAVMEGHPPSSRTSSSLSAAASLEERFFKLHADLENIMFFV